MNLLGKLDWSAIPFDQPIIMGTGAFMVLAIISILSWITLKGYVPYLWREWITSVDHKRVGVMCFLLTLVMLLWAGSLIRRPASCNSPLMSASITIFGDCSSPASARC
jgi:hypothetical protein